MKDKSIFDVHALNTDEFAKSLGLAIPPRIRFLQRMQKKIKNQDLTESEEENSQENANEFNSDDCLDEKSTCKEFEKHEKAPVKGFASCKLKMNDFNINEKYSLLHFFFDNSFCK